MLGFCALDRMRDDARQHQIEWHTAALHFWDKPPEVKEAYHAGFDQGWAECLKTLRLHKAAQVDMTK